MIYITSFCLFFILFPLFIAILKNLIWFFSGPKDDSDYHNQLFPKDKSKILLELSIELFIAIVSFVLFLVVNNIL